MTRPVVACLGAGRMGRGIAVTFAYAGHEVRLIDFKPRDADAFAALKADAEAELRSTLESLAHFCLMQPEDVDPVLARISIHPDDDTAARLTGAGMIFEGIPEILALKREALARASALADADAMIASTTSTILVTELASAVQYPGRFLNAHFLNPAYLIPLVELSPAASTDPEVTARFKALLESIGKVPVICAAIPGYIVPRLQVVAMNEAARMVEEGVASAEDIDRAVRFGFGPRYSVLGLLEFIDWGGGDILYHASRYLTEALGNARYTAPDIIARNMEQGHLGMRSGRGFLDYETMDVDAFRQDRLRAFVDLLRMIGMTRPPLK
jgi:3-hydroxybutyryl-CoA dehydrogenase